MKINTKKYRVIFYTIHDSDIPEDVTVEASDKKEAFELARKQAFPWDWDKLNIRKPLRLWITEV
jgi:hypothetical protein